MKRPRREKGQKPADGLSLKAIRTAEANTNDFDNLIHERTRLGIVSALAANGKLSFSDLKHILQISDGNLSVHGRKLEDAGYVLVTKSFAGRVPRTEYEITETGRIALRRYLDHMERLINAMKEPNLNNEK